MEQGKQENISLNNEEKKIEPTSTNESTVEQTNTNSTTNIFGQEVTPLEPKEEVKVPQVEEKQEPPVVEQQTNVEPNVEVQKDVQVVYEYKPKKDYGIWPILAFFILTAGIIFALPSIQKLVNDYRNGGIDLSNKNNIPSENKPKEETPTEELSYFDFNGETTVSINKLTLNNFSKETANGKYYLDLTVLNKDNRIYNYEDKIFIELYNANDTLLSRSLLESKVGVASSSSLRVSLLINEKAYKEVAKFLVKTISVSDYPQINLEENLKDQEVLTCSLDNEKNIYTFKDYKLVSIDSTADFLKSSYFSQTDYASALATYRQQSASYGLYNGVSSSIVDAEDGFTLAIKIDSGTLSIGDLTEMANRAFYKGNTLAKEVVFEMSSRGYTCN